MYSFQPIEHDKEHLDLYAKFLSEVFPKSPLFSPEYLEWLYVKNPNGRCVGFSAVHKGKVVSHYVNIPVSASYKGRAFKGLTTLQTATHPEHRGKGLFTKLAQLTNEQIVKMGYQFVWAIANASSTPGYVKKMGFTLVCQLDVWLGFGSIRYARARDSFYLLWNDETISWRMQNPSAKYCMVYDQNSGSVRYYADTHIGPIKAMLRTLDQSPPEMLAALQPCPFPRATLWIGKAQGLSKKGIFFPLPERLKPSPLNLIFRSFDPELPLPSAGEVNIDLFDFDAY